MATNHGIVNELRKSYAMELETVENYLANSIDLDGVRAEEIKKSLLRDIEVLQPTRRNRVGRRIVPHDTLKTAANRFISPDSPLGSCLPVLRQVARDCLGEPRLASHQDVT